MITLDTINKTLEIKLSGVVAANQLVYTTDYIDVPATTFSGGGNDGVTNNATAVTAVAAPAVSTSRFVKFLSIYNLDTTQAVLTVQVNNNGTKRALWTGMLLPSETLNYIDGIGFRVLDPNGTQKYTGASIGIGTERAMDASREQRVLRGQSNAIGSTAALVGSGEAQWVYLGRTSAAVTIKYVEFHVSTAGVGAQTAEVALVSSPLAPNKTYPVLTHLASDGTLDDLTSTGVKRNTSALNYTVAAGVHLWAGARFAMANTQPKLVFRGASYDQSQRYYGTTASAGALTAGGPWTLALSSTISDLRATLD